MMTSNQRRHPPHPMPDFSVLMFGGGTGTGVGSGTCFGTGVGIGGLSGEGLGFNFVVDCGGGTGAGTGIGVGCAVFVFSFVADRGALCAAFSFSQYGHRPSTVSAWCSSQNITSTKSLLPHTAHPPVSDRSRSIPQLRHLFSLTIIYFQSLQKYTPQRFERQRHHGIFYLIV